VSAQHRNAGTDIKRLMYSEREIAAMFPISARTLQKWRLLNKGPKWYRAAGRIFYDPTEFEQWIRSGAQGGAAA
jgi:hypothetical protein